MIEHSLRRSCKRSSSVVLVRPTTASASQPQTAQAGLSRCQLTPRVAYAIRCEIALQSVADRTYQCGARFLSRSPCSGRELASARSRLSNRLSPLLDGVQHANQQEVVGCFNAQMAIALDKILSNPGVIEELFG